MSFSDSDQPRDPEGPVTPGDPRPPAWWSPEAEDPPATAPPAWSRPGAAGDEVRTVEVPPVPPASSGEVPPAPPTSSGEPPPAPTTSSGQVPPPAGAVPPPPGAEPRRSWWRSTGEWVLVVALALGAAFLVKTFVLQTFYIPSASMEPTLLVGDRVFVNKLAYNFHPIHRGDIVVFTLPPGESAGPGIDDLIKRVVGLPGDTIEAIGGRVYIDGRPLDEPYLPRGTITTLLPRQKVKPGEYFLMGDNRTDSKDSRFFGTIAESRVVGRAFVRIWPLSRIGLL